MIKKINFSWHWLFWLTLFIFFCLCNFLLLPVSDDLNYSGNGLGYAVFFYMHWAGRFGSMVSALFARHMNPMVFDVINAVIGTFFFFLLFLCIEGEKPSSRQDIGKLSFLIIGVLLTTMFGSFFIWTSGAVDYLWGYTLILLHWLPFRFYWKNNNFNLSWERSTLVIVLSLFAGWASEQVGIMSILVHICMVLYSLYKKRFHFPYWYWASIIAFILGFCLLYFSPGLSERSIQAASQEGYYYSFGQLLSMNTWQLLGRIWSTVGTCTPQITFVLFCIILFFLLFYKAKNRIHILLIFIISVGLIAIIRFAFFPFVLWYLKTAIVFLLFIVSIVCILKNVRRLESLLYLLFFISLLSAIQVGFIPERSKMGESLILLTICLLLMKEYIPNIFTSRLFPALCLLCYIGVTLAFYDFHQKQCIIEEEIYRQKEAGQKEVVVPEKYFHSNYFGIGDFYGCPCNNPDPPESWLLDGYSQYYGVNEIFLK